MITVHGNTVLLCSWSDYFCAYFNVSRNATRSMNSCTFIPAARPEGMTDMVLFSRNLMSFVAIVRVWPALSTSSREVAVSERM